MNRSIDPPAHPAPRSRSWIAWIVVAVAAVALAASFVIRGGDETSAQRGRGERKPTPVAAAPVERGPITQRGRYPGELIADTADVAAFYAGRLVTVHVRVGDLVKQGDVIAELDPVDAREQIAQARAQARAAAAERARAQVERDAALAEVERLEPLARDKLISALEIDRQRARAKALAATVESAAAGEAEATARVRVLDRRVVESKVRAPFAGRVAARYVDPGAIVAAGARLIRIVESDPLRVRFEVPERDVAQLTEGTAARVVTQTAETAAKVTGIAGEVSRERRVAAVEALIEKPPPGWLPGMYADVVVDLRTLEQATIVPSAAVVSRMQPTGTLATGLFVAEGDTARWIPVREVTRDDDRVAIAAEPGTLLAPGARVLIQGHLDLIDGSPIRVTDAPGTR
jgi:RND family efflux transporter MFP subunit